jgi:mRNA interferase MazF
VARGLAWGDIRLVDLGRPDKRRPALVLTRTSAAPYLNTVTVAPITRTIRGVPTEVSLGVDEGMKEHCVANFHSLQTVSTKRLGRHVGSLGVSRKPEVRRALLFALELEASASE